MSNELKAEQLCDQGGRFMMENKTAEGIKCFLQAVELGSSRGMVNLGYCYENGFGVDLNPEESYKWYRRAADLDNNPFGQRNVGSCFQHGRGVAQDPKEAVVWYTKAAKQNHGEARNDLGNCYDKGIGVAADSAKAAHWYGKSAESGFPWGICNLASCYADGYGVEANPKRAFELYMEAAKEPVNYPLGQYSVGACYFHGIGVEKDLLKAIDWFTKAAEQGDENAQHNLEALNVKRCPTCKKWKTRFSQKIHNGKEDMMVCLNEQCPDDNVVFNAVTRELISGKKCPKCGGKRDILNTGAWACRNDGCPAQGKIDRRF